MNLKDAAEVALEALNKRINGNFDGSTYTDIEYMASEALRQALAQPEKEPVAFKDAPHRIYLQVCQDDVCEVPFSEHSDVSWCEDKINELDVPYIRADLYIAPPTTPDSATRSADSAESFCKQELHNLMSVAGRMALELECLLLDTENLSVVSKWWDTGIEALQAYRHYVWSVTHGKDGENFCDTHCVHTDHHPDCELAQPEQEPVAHLWECLGRWSAYLANNGTSAMLSPPGYLIHAINVATKPPKREWVGLTDEEIQKVVYDMGTIGDLSHDEFDICHAVIAKLKEKNNG